MAARGDAARMDEDAPAEAALEQQQQQQQQQQQLEQQHEQQRHRRHDADEAAGAADGGAREDAARSHKREAQAAELQTERESLEALRAGLEAEAARLAAERAELAHARAALGAAAATVAAAAAEAGAAGREAAAGAAAAPVPQPAGAMLQGPEDAYWFVEVTPAALEVARFTELVTDPSAGAIAAFVGTTRDTFQGARVLKLEYEAYVPMALGKLKDLCLQVRQRWGVTRVAVAHRVGTVEVCQASVVIAVSSPHRRAALEAVHWAIDELKATVPIWKKEFFADGSVWKENEESRRLLASVQRSEIETAGA